MISITIDGASNSQALRAAGLTWSLPDEMN
jgi:hypothetical protein